MKTENYGDIVLKSVVSVANLHECEMVEIGGYVCTVNKKYINAKDSVYAGERYPNGITRIQFKVPTANGFRIEG